MSSRTTARPASAATRPARPIKAVAPHPAAARENANYLHCGPLIIETRDLTAEIAAEYLARNTNNRPIRPKQLASFVRDMNNGDWLPVGDPIRFTTDEDICDGQHRLEALVMANPGIVLPSVIVRGLHPDHRHVIDIGARRTAADQLRIAGYSNSVLLAAGAKWSIIMERLREDGGKLQSSVTHSEILAYVSENDLMYECIAQIANGSIGRRIDMPSGYICAAYYQMALVHEGDADEFIARLADGVNLSQGDPILALRDSLRELHLAQTAVPGEGWLSMIVRAWNARRQGETMRKIHPFVVRNSKDPKDRRKIIPIPDVLA